MAASKVSISNSALIKLGSETLIALTDDTKRAKLCNARIDGAIAEVLRMGNWSCARTRISMTPTTTTPSSEYTYKYNLPGDLIKIERVAPEISQLDYKVEGNTLLTDEGSLDLVYIKHPTDLNDLDHLCADAIATWLAKELAFAITSDKELKRLLLQEFNQMLSKARTADSQEGKKRNFRASKWLQGRISGPNQSIPPTR
jgi:hypothetical protein